MALISYQLAYGAEAIWSGRALVRLSCIQHTRQSFRWLPHPLLSQSTLGVKTH